MYNVSVLIKHPTIYTNDVKIKDYKLLYKVNLYSNDTFVESKTIESTIYNSTFIIQDINKSQTSTAYGNMGIKVVFNNIELSVGSMVHTEVLVTNPNNRNWSNTEAINKVVSHKKEVKNDDVFIHFKGKHFIDYGNNIIEPNLRLDNLDTLKKDCENDNQCNSILHFTGGNSGVSFKMGHLFKTKPNETQLSPNSQFDVYVKK
tara:strand:+ start:169 stop:777 length:609 start_codon:yes stop_codon:yes gene_type:complete